MDNLAQRKQAVLAHIAALRTERASLQTELAACLETLSGLSGLAAAVRNLPDAAWRLLPAALREACARYREDA